MSDVSEGDDPPRLPELYEPQLALDHLASELVHEYERTGRPVPLTLTVHGFNTRRKSFERQVVEDGKAGPTDTFRPEERFLVGFRWPSEGLFSIGSLKDTVPALFFSPAIGMFLLLLPCLVLFLVGAWSRLLGGLRPGLGGVLDRPAQTLHGAFQAAIASVFGWWPPLEQFVRTLFAPYGEALFAAALLGAGMLLLTLRVSTYLRDRYRALHYGVPDLGEFVRALEERLNPEAGEDSGAQKGQAEPRAKIALDVIGHSMGTLLLINALRVMSDYFHGSGPHGPDGSLGRNGTFQLRTLILCGADIPAVMATPDRNNYFLAALRRFRSVHVFSSDRDVMLKWLSSLANWATEPRYDMSGRKLGIVFLARRKPRFDAGKSAPGLWPVTRPVFRSFHVFDENPEAGVGRKVELHFHDCTRTRSLGGTTGSQAMVVVVFLCSLVALSYWLGPGTFQWLAAITVFTAIGLLGRALWPVLRDKRFGGGLAGLLAEWPVWGMFAIWWVGWNPHGGYFMRREEPRKRISDILRDSTLFPPRVGGQVLEEQDGLIRYRLVRIAV